jgi:hypothetical protein
LASQSLSLKTSFQFKKIAGVTTNNAIKLDLYHSIWKEDDIFVL